jgi:hypothetical protein
MRWVRSMVTVAVVMVVADGFLVDSAAAQSDTRARTEDWTLTGSMVSARSNSTATLMPDGNVLVAGGLDGAGHALASAEVYEPATGTWALTESMSTPRFNFAATLLADGRVLTVGGQSTTSALSSAEIYDPSTGSWSLTGSMSTPRTAHLAALIAAGPLAGDVLVAGGSSVCGGCTPILASAELYDPGTGTWSSTGSMAVARYWEMLSAVATPDGSVLVEGGVTCCPYQWIDEAESYSSSTQRWTPTSPKETPAQGPATLLANGQVLVAGGRTGSQPSAQDVAAAEVFDASTNTWSPTGSMSVDRTYDTQTLLPSGKVLVEGGNSGGWGVCNDLTSTELYDPGTGAWSSAGAISAARSGPTAMLLPSGQVLVAGGWECDGTVLSSAELYTPSTSFIGGLTTITPIASTEAANGDLNPYGSAVVPAAAGNLVAGDVLVSNFNNATNFQGTGTTIVQVAPDGRVRTFATINPKSLPGPCPGGVGLTTALAALPGGWVVVGSLPTTDGTAATARGGCLLVLDDLGNVQATIAGGSLNGPWGMTSTVLGPHRVDLFVSNVLKGTVAGGGSVVHRGTVVRVGLYLHGMGVPTVSSETVIGSRFGERTDPAALVVGPTGLGLGSDGTTLYVADTVGNRIASIPFATTRKSTAFTGTTVTIGGALNGPLGLAIAPNGDVLTVNRGDGNIVETTPDGLQVATATLDLTGAGTLFGLAVTPAGDGIYFVDDATNTLELFH